MGEAIITRRGGVGENDAEQWYIPSESSFTAVESSSSLKATIDGPGWVCGFVPSEDSGAIGGGIALKCDGVYVLGGSSSRLYYDSGVPFLCRFESELLIYTSNDDQTVAYKLGDSFKDAPLSVWSDGLGSGSYSGRVSVTGSGRIFSIGQPSSASTRYPFRLLIDGDEVVNSYLNGILYVDVPYTESFEVQFTGADYDMSHFINYMED
jgi:hypothetical protein